MSLIKEDIRRALGHHFAIDFDTNGSGRWYAFDPTIWVFRVNIDLFVLHEPGICMAVIRRSPKITGWKYKAKGCQRLR
jgi:hypothetical protein